MPYTEYYVDSTNGDNRNSGSSEGSPSWSSTGSYTTTTRVFVCDSSPSGNVDVGDIISVTLTSRTASTDLANYVGRVSAVSGSNVTIASTAIAIFDALSSGTHSCTLRKGGAWLGGGTSSSYPLDEPLDTIKNTSGHYIRLNYKNNSPHTFADAANTILGSAHNGITIQGYKDTPGDGGRAIISKTAQSGTCTFSSSRSFIVIQDLIFESLGGSGNSAFLTISCTHSLFRNVSTVGGRGTAFSITGTSNSFYDCDAVLTGTGTSTCACFYITNQTVFDGCVAWLPTASTCVGFQLWGWAWLKNCIAHSVTSDGFQRSGGTTGINLFDNCLAFGCGRYGFYFTVARNYLEHCLAIDNIDYGFTANSTSVDTILKNCGYYNNAGGSIHSNLVNHDGCFDFGYSPISVGETGFELIGDTYKRYIKRQLPGAYHYYYNLPNNHYNYYDLGPRQNVQPTQPRTRKAKRK